jgi:hypothetical protein
LFSKSSLHEDIDVRTKWQQDGTPGGSAMIDTVKTALRRQQNTLWQDALGALSLAVILYGALHLPVL